MAACLPFIGCREAALVPVDPDTLDGGDLGVDPLEPPNAGPVQELAWRPFDAVPEARFVSAAAYDASRGVVVLFGGCTQQGSSATDSCRAVAGDTWEWNGVTWTDRTRGVSPSARAGHAMVYDPGARRVLLFGGCAEWGAEGCTGPLADTWEWDGISWVERHPEQVPPPRSEHALAFDAERGRAVLYGGILEETDATWEWDGNDWAEITAAGPVPRLQHAMAYDAVGSRTVVFGGRTRDEVLDDVWEWDGSSWTRVENTERSPSPRFGHRMVVAAPDSLAVFGGCEVLDATKPFRCGEPLDEVRQLDGREWTTHHYFLPGGPSAMPAVATDFAHGSVAIFGGYGGERTLTDMQLWTDEGWEQPSNVDRPVSRYVTHLAYHSGRGTVVLFGGEAGGFPQDTWELGDGWTMRGDGTGLDPFEPPGRRGGAMAYHAARDVVVLFAGWTLEEFANDTWIWEFQQWRSMSGTFDPPARYYHAMAYDARREKVVLFGGLTSNEDAVELGDLWEWDGDWQPRMTEYGPEGRHLTAMAYDPLRERIVLYGGTNESGHLSDLWEWDGSEWEERSYEGGPGPRSHHAMAFDSRRQTVILFGGTSGEMLDDTWEWDGEDWSQIMTSRTPGPRALVGMADDVGRFRMVLFGGQGDTWLLEPGPADVSRSCAFGFDADNDGLLGCEDFDCFAACEPMCAAHLVCEGERSRCGDQVCSQLEDCHLCPSDCHFCVPICGDYTCSAGESCASCPGDCSCP